MEEKNKLLPKKILRKSNVNIESLISQEILVSNVVASGDELEFGDFESTFDIIRQSLKNKKYSELEIEQVIASINSNNFESTILEHKVLQ